MPVSLIQFAGETGDGSWGEVKRKVYKGIRQTMKLAGHRILRRVVRATPVDTGRARSNWQVGIGTIVADNLEPYLPYEKGTGSFAETENAQAAIEAGDEVLNGYKRGDIFISNDVENPRYGTKYIDHLNSGSSTQAGSNFVNVAVLAGINEIDGVDVLSLADELDPALFSGAEFNDSFDFGAGAPAPF
jgi:hypothetical protein